jgi:hypothetical protein
MRGLKAWLAAVVVAAGCGVALGDLCAKCKDKMFTTDIGACTQCKAQTCSGAFKLCPECSKKLGQCEACRASLATTKPATMPGK